MGGLLTAIENPQQGVMAFGYLIFLDDDDELRHATDDFNGVDVVDFYFVEDCC